MPGLLRDKLRLGDGLSLLTKDLLLLPVQALLILLLGRLSRRDVRRLRCRHPLPRR